MRKRLALLLAVVMSISLLSVNVFAASDNYVDNVLNVPSGSLLLEHGVLQNEDYYVDKNGDQIKAYQASADKDDLGWEYDDEDVKWFIDGTDLVLALRRNVATGASVGLTLEGAEFYFAQEPYKNPDTGLVKTANSYDPKKGSVVLTTNKDRNGVDRYFSYERKNDPDDEYISTSGAITSAISLSYKMEIGKDSKSATITLLEAVPSATAVDRADTYIIRVPLVVLITGDEASVRVDGGNVSTVSSTPIKFASTSSGKTRTTHDGDAVEDRDYWDLDDIKITELTTGSIRSYEIASLTLPEGLAWVNDWEAQDDDPDDDLGLYLSGGLTFSDGTRDGHYVSDVYDLFKEALEYYVDYYLTDSSNRIKLPFATDDDKASFFEDISLPIYGDRDGNGFINDQDMLTYADAIKAALARVDNGYGITYGLDLSSTNTDKLAAQIKNIVAGIDTGTIWVWFGGVNASDQLRGTAYIEGLEFYSLDDDTFPRDGSEIYVSIDSANGGITDEKFLVGKRVDWEVVLKTNGAIPTLASGRYIGPSWDGTDANDATHKTASITISEAASVSWWGARSTVLALPATDNKGTVLGAKFRKVKVTKTSNIEEYLGAKPEDYEVPNGDTPYSLNNPHGYTATGEGVYLNDGVRHANITVDDNKITISNLRIASNKKASITMDLWVSLELGFGAQYGGELEIAIDPVLSTSLASSAAPAKAVIAHVKDPVTVSTKVSDLKIGYQFQTTSDITITENFAHALLKDKTVSVSVTDYASDLIFDGDIQVKVTSGNLEIKNVRAAGLGGFTTQSGSWLGAKDETGTLSFDISKESTQASTITISTVGVRLDRTIPVTNKNAYNVLVWDTAIAENYGLYDDAGRQWKADFATVGVSVPYVNVVTSANDAASVLTQEVRIGIGQSFYTVNGTTFSLETGAEAYLENGNTMVPVRFVSNALGIRDDQIIWDQGNKTVTIITPSKVVQFTVGEATITVDGVKIPAVGADKVTPVSAVLKDPPGRTFLPIRALGEVFGITVDWEAETQTVIYNKGANQNKALATTNTAIVS
ncbi:MAG: copper amine oxidase N-terminal domain-containing protein [Clostridiales bacterium]|jgi:hypothetical protein|nr:copper amine oxidase N-terminal domain-containing protein [Clostridiales bacterium]